MPQINTHCHQIFIRNLNMHNTTEILEASILSSLEFKSSGIKGKIFGQLKPA